jgi:DAK2 domain fusion protein YloV
VIPDAMPVARPGAIPGALPGALPGAVSDQVGPRSVLDGAAAARWAGRALAALGSAREEIDALNVFPVPDADTGTNLFLTLESAVSAAAGLPPDTPVADLAEAFARGALLGARGSSGAIGAQLLRGWADTLAECGLLDAEAAVEGFRRADEQAWRAVAQPVAGTILTVSRAAAMAATAELSSLRALPDAARAPQARISGSVPALQRVVQAAASAARRALELTTSQLPALAAAGVVDAGGRGLVVLLDCLADLVSGASAQAPARHPRPVALPVADLDACARRTPRAGMSGPAYEVMYLVDLPDAAALELLRARLAPLGDSLVVVGGGGLWHVHIHAYDAGAAVEAAMDLGRPHRIRITGLASDPLRPVFPAPARHDDPVGSHLSRRTGLVAVAAGPGLAALFAGAGAIVLERDAGRRVGADEVLRAVRDAGARRVVVLPNDAQAQAAAQAAAVTARTEGIAVSVIPTRAQVQGLAAAAVHDAGRAFDDDLVAMSAAAGAARDGAVTVATTDGLTTAGPCRAGDVLGVVDGDFAVVGNDPREVALQVLDRLLSLGGELVTLVVGAGGHHALADEVAAHLRRHNLPLEVSVLAGGQQRYPLLIGVE